MQVLDRQRETRRKLANALQGFGRQLASRTPIAVEHRGLAKHNSRIVVLRTMSGEDLELKIGRDWTCRDVYQEARAILGLLPVSPTSLRLQFVANLPYAFRSDPYSWAVGALIPNDKRLCYNLLAGTVLGVVRY